MLHQIWKRVLIIISFLVLNCKLLLEIIEHFLPYRSFTVFKVCSIRAEDFTLSGSPSPVQLARNLDFNYYASYINMLYSLFACNSFPFTVGYMHNLLISNQKGAV